MKTTSLARRAYVPLVVLGSLLWLALIVAGDALVAELPQSMGCADPHAAPFSALQARSGPCRAGAFINPAIPRRNRHDTPPQDHVPA